MIKKSSIVNFAYKILKLVLLNSFESVLTIFKDAKNNKLTFTRPYHIITKTREDKNVIVLNHLTTTVKYMKLYNYQYYYTMLPHHGKFVV